MACYPNDRSEILLLFLSDSSHETLRLGKDTGPARLMERSMRGLRFVNLLAGSTFLFLSGWWSIHLLLLSLGITSVAPEPLYTIGILALVAAFFGLSEIAQLTEKSGRS